jgi:fructose-1,6-bisphosphatase/inositol monophosphatase family enzyme
MMIEIASELGRMQDAIISACESHFSNIPLQASQIHTKSSGSYKEIFTSVDLNLSQDILRAARVTLPESYSEEELPSTVCQAAMLWQIDPLDGTDEFIEGLPQYCGVSAGLLKRLDNGMYESIAGILYLPAQNLLISGDRTSNTVTILQNGTPVPLPQYKRSSVIGYSRFVDPSDKARQYYANLASKLGISFTSIACGGAAHGFASLVMGQINVLFLNYDHSKEWDTSAAQPIIEALDGFVCDLDGQDFQYNRNDHFNRRGFISSIAFLREELLPSLVDDLLDHRLAGQQSQKSSNIVRLMP